MDTSVHPLNPGSAVPTGSAVPGVGAAVREQSESSLTQSQVDYLDLIRAVAANLVVLEHISRIFNTSAKIEFGTLGVTIFFILSGFLIFMSAYRRLGSPRVEFFNFMAERTARIFVPYIPALIVVTAINAFVDIGHWGLPGVNTGPAAFFANLFMLQDYPVFQALTHLPGKIDFHLRAYNGAEQLWTIPIEYWLYTSFALVMFCFFKRERINGWVVAIAAMVSTPVVIWNSFAGVGDDLSLIWILGALIGYLWVTKIQMIDRPRLVGFALIVFGVIGVAGRIMQRGFSPYEFQTTVFICCMIVGGLLFVRRPVWPAVFGQFAGFLASYSYSLYLVHNVILIFFGVKLSAQLGAFAPWVAFIAAHAVAYTIYILFERHHKKVARYLKAQIARTRGA